MNFYKSFRRCIDVVIEVEKHISIICLAAMLILGSIQILTRTVLGQSFVWIYPLTILLFCYMTFIGFAVVFKKKEYIIVESLTQLFPEAIQQKLELIINFFMLIIFIFILSLAPKIIEIQNITMQIIHIPRYVQAIPLFVASATIILILLYEIFGTILGKEGTT